MKISPITVAAAKARTARSLGHHVFSLLLVGLISLSLPVALGRAQPSSCAADGEEVLTRGPVHEAFAAVVSYNPEPGIIVRKRPPELVEELPPEERPEGDDVAWIPGYWGWDDERNDFLWISGTWRAVPPGRDWAAGYWRENEAAAQAQQNVERAKAKEEARRNAPEGREKQPDEPAEANPAPKDKLAEDGDDVAKKDKYKSRK